MRTQKQVCVSCRAYIFILRTFSLNACRSSCICHWADYPGSRGSVLSHLAWINQTGTERRSHRRRLLIRKPHTLSLVRLFVYNPLGGFMLFTACLQERTAGGRGLQGLFETDSLISSLVTGSRHETEKSCLTRTEPTFYTSLWQASDFSILSRGCSLIVLWQTQIQPFVRKITICVWKNHRT